MSGASTRRVREITPEPLVEWRNGPLAPEVSEREVHIWRVDLSRTAVDCQAVLSDGERARAARLHFARDRRRFQIAHASLRILLGRYLNLSPSALVFGETNYGKPFLVNPEAVGLLFNMARTGDVLVIAVTRDREVGVDVELMREDLATIDFAGQAFSVAEIYTLTGLPRHLRTRGFFNCWTRKEAYVKARGERLVMPLDQFDVALAPDVPAALLENRVDDAEVSRWLFYDLSAASGVAGSVVVESLKSHPEVSHFAFSA